MHINARPWLSALLLSMYSRGTDHRSRGGRKGKKIITGQESSADLIPRHRRCDNLEPVHLHTSPQLTSLLSFSFFKVLKVSMKWNHIGLTSITLALRYKKSTTGTFRKCPQTDPCPHFKWKSPPDTRRRSEAARRQRWQKACVRCCSCRDGKPERTKSKCCFHFCHCLTLTPSLIHLDNFEPETHEDKEKPFNVLLSTGVLTVAGPPPYYLYIISVFIVNIRI